LRLIAPAGFELVVKLLQLLAADFAQPCPRQGRIREREFGDPLIRRQRS